MLQQIQYPTRPFGPPPSDPSDWFDPSWLAAIDQHGHQTDAIPVLPIEYRYWHQSIFYQGEPSDQVNPAYYEAWQNLPTWLMPVLSIEDLFGPYARGISGGFWSVMVIAPPVFLPNGTRVASPTSTKITGAKGSGRTSTTRKQS